MRITQIMLASGFGGAERHFVDLSLELAARGHRIQVICHPDGESRAHFDGVPGIEIATVATRGAWDRLAPRRVRALIDEFWPSVINTHLARAAHMTSIALRGTGLPVVANTHNYVQLKYYQGVDHFIVPTASQRDYLAQSGIPAQRISTIPHFSRLATTTTTDAYPPATFVSVGRLVKKKGYDVLLHALAELAQSEHQFSVSIAGDGPERAALEARCGTFGLQDKVRFVGWIENIADLIDSGQIFVLPSLDEPFGIVVLEAMARKRAIVSTKTHGPTEILDDRVAWLVAPNDVTELAGALRAALQSTTEREQRADAAFERYMTLYDCSAVIPQYETLYANIVDGTSRDAPAAS